MMGENVVVSFSELFICWVLFSPRDAVGFVFMFWEPPFLDIGFDASFFFFCVSVCSVLLRCRHLRCPSSLAVIFLVGRISAAIRSVDSDALIFFTIITIIIVVCRRGNMDSQVTTRSMTIDDCGNVERVVGRMGD